MSVDQNQYPGKPETRPDLDIYDGTHGFHWTRDEGIVDILMHGLLSRRERMSRGMPIGKASRSPSDSIYFTTNPGELYLITVFNDLPGQYDQYGDSHQSQLDHAVGIVVERPDFAYTKQGHFVHQDIVEPTEIEGLIFVDRMAAEISKGHPGRATHEFSNPEDPAKIGTKVDLLRDACQQAGIDIPICGISGQVYYEPVGTLPTPATE